MQLIDLAELNLVDSMLWQAPMLRARRQTTNFYVLKQEYQTNYLSSSLVACMNVFFIVFICLGQCYAPIIPVTSPTKANIVVKKLLKIKLNTIQTNQSKTVFFHSKKYRRLINHNASKDATNSTGIGTL
tara:strand:+ start:74 stop:460 length:387 start_codon:yes stop_codon:yes gene_type:complete